MRSLIMMILTLGLTCQAQTPIELFKNGETIVPHQMVVAGHQPVQQVKSNTQKPSASEKGMSFDQVIERDNKSLVLSIESDNATGMSSEQTDLKKEAVENIVSSLSWYNQMIDVQKRDKSHYFTEKGWALFKKNVWPLYHQKIGTQISKIVVTALSSGSWMSKSPTTRILSVPVSFNIDHRSGNKSVSFNVITVLRFEKNRWAIDGLDLQSII